MTDTLSPLSGALTVRHLRRDRALAPGGDRFPDVVRKFLPLVHGTALALIPENPAAAETVARAVFETLAIRWRSLSRKTALATWLTRSTWLATARERSALGLARKPQTPEGQVAFACVKAVTALKASFADAVLACHALNEPLEEAAAALRVKPARLGKWRAAGAAKLNKRLQKIAARLQAPQFDAAAYLAAMPLQPPPEMESGIVEAMAAWQRKTKRSRLAAKTVAAWQWIGFRRFCKGIAAGVAITLCALVGFGLTMKFLIDGGHFNLALAFTENMQKGLAKEFPGMLAPARPWPVTPEDRRHASLAPPKSSAELYGLTNIWLARIILTPSQWKAIQPKSIPPVQNNGGPLALRNSKASRSGLAGALGIDFHWGEGSFEFAGETFDPVGVRFRGNGTFLNSLFGHKQSYKVDLNRVKKGQSIVGVSTLNFVNSIPDFSYVKDALAEKLFRELGAVAPRTAYAYLTVDAPGALTNQPLGLFALIENIDADFAKDRFGSKAVPIFKPVDYNLFSDLGKSWEDYREIYDLKTKATEEQLQRVVDMAHLVSHAGDEEFATRLPDFLDLEEYAAFLAGHVLLSSYDGYLSNGQNFYMYLDPRSNKFGFIPWDQDHAWGEFAYVSTAEKRETASIWKPASYNNKFLARVLKVEAFRVVYRKKLEEALAGPFTVERLNRDVDMLAAAIRPAVAAESAFRLQRFEIAVSTNWVSGPRDGHMHDGTAEGPRRPAHQIKRFILARTQSVRDQLDGKSEGSLITGFGN